MVDKALGFDSMSSDPKLQKVGLFGIVFFSCFLFFFFKILRRKCETCLNELF